MTNWATRTTTYLEIATHGLRKSRVESGIQEDGVIQTKRHHAGQRRDKLQSAEESVFSTASRLQLKALLRCKHQRRATCELLVHVNPLP